MLMQHTYGIFETEADHLIAMVRQHAPLEQVRAAGCPACGSELSIAFSEDGTVFVMSCVGKRMHMTTYQHIADPPPWWRECVHEPTDSEWYWRVSHSLDADGNLSMPISGWRADGVRWSGGFTCPVDDPDYPFWRWVLLDSGCTSDLINLTELAELRDRFGLERPGGSRD